MLVAINQGPLARGSSSDYISLREASSLCAYSQDYLSLRARKGKLRAKKLGRNWVTRVDWLQEYIERSEQYFDLLDKQGQQKEVAPVAASVSQGIPSPVSVSVSVIENTPLQQPLIRKIKGGEGPAHLPWVPVSVPFGYLSAQAELRRRHVARVVGAGLRELQALTLQAALGALLLVVLTMSAVGWMIARPEVEARARHFQEYLRAEHALLSGVANSSVAYTFVSAERVVKKATGAGELFVREYGRGFARVSATIDSVAASLSSSVAVSSHQARAVTQRERSRYIEPVAAGFSDFFSRGEKRFNDGVKVLSLLGSPEVAADVRSIAEEYGAYIAGRASEYQSDLSRSVARLVSVSADAVASIRQPAAFSATANAASVFGEKSLASIAALFDNSTASVAPRDGFRAMLSEIGGGIRFFLTDLFADTHLEGQVYQYDAESVLVVAFSDPDVWGSVYRSVESVARGDIWQQALSFGKAETKVLPLSVRAGTAAFIASLDGSFLQWGSQLLVDWIGGMPSRVSALFADSLQAALSEPRFQERNEAMRSCVSLGLVGSIERVLLGTSFQCD